MTIAEPMLLPSDVELTPVEELPEEIRAQLTYRPGDHAVTRPRARSASSIVDGNTARLLGSFRTPTRIVDAVLGLRQRASARPARDARALVPGAEGSPGQRLPGPRRFRVRRADRGVGAVRRQRRSAGSGSFAPCT